MLHKNINISVKIRNIAFFYEKSTSVYIKIPPFLWGKAVF